MTPLCLHREEWVCEKCLKCTGCCTCNGTIVHRNSAAAAAAYSKFIRGRQAETA